MRDLLIIAVSIPLLGLVCIGAIVLVSYVVNYIKTKDYTNGDSND